MRPRLQGFAGALGVVVAAALVAVSTSSLLGLSSMPGPGWVAVAVLVVASPLVLPAPDSDAWRGGAWVGAVVGLASVASFWTLDIGGPVAAAQLGAIGGSIVAVAVLDRFWSSEPSSDVGRLGLLIIFLLVGGVLVRAVVDAGALGHDEAAYALKARSWIENTPDSGWSLHRAPLLSIIGTVVISFTSSELVIRLVSAALALLALGALGLLAHRIGGIWAAVISTATVGASLSFLRRGSEFLTDVPAAGALLLAVWFLMGVAGEQDSVARKLVLAGLFIAAAFYFRYQSALSAVGIAFGFVLAWPRLAARLKNPLLSASLLTVAMAVPHLVWATLATGSPLGVVFATGDAAGRDFLGEGLVDYLNMFPSELVGPAGAVVMALGIVWIAFHVVRAVSGQRPSQGRLGVFVLVIVVVSVIPLGLVAHGEPRFVFFPTWLLIAFGSAAAVRLVGKWRPHHVKGAVVVATVLWLPLLAVTAESADRNAEARGEEFEVVVSSAGRVAADGIGSCAVLTTYMPQITWYSGCETELLSQRGDGVGVERLEADREYVLFFENGKRQPPASSLAELTDDGRVEEIPSSGGDIGPATLIELDES